MGILSKKLGMLWNWKKYKGVGNAIQVVRNTIEGVGNTIGKVGNPTEGAKKKLEELQIL